MRADQFAARHFPVLALAVLIVAAFNLTFNVRNNAIGEWDESLYGLSAAEMLDTGDWIVTRLNGEVDYSLITKPPLMVWLTALSFKMFGVSAISLRLVSIVSAWLTILVVVSWARRIAGPLTAIAAGVVLATSFGFMFAHSGRTGNTDALFALLTTLTAVVLHASFARPWAWLGLGLLFAALFLLRGPGMLMPLLIVALVALWRRRAPARWPALAAALAVFAIPVAAWALARWSADGWRFLTRVWEVDLVTRTLTSFEGHEGTPFYYLNILQRYHYDWLVATVGALTLFPPTLARWREWLSLRPDAHPYRVVIIAWAVVAFMVPTLMQTKLPWYLNPFYPVFALLVGAVLRYALVNTDNASRGRTIALGTVLVLALGTAEGKMVYQGFRRDTRFPLQQLLARERSMLGGRTIFRSEWNTAERFVAVRMIGSRVAQVPPGVFADIGGPDDFLVAAADLSDARLQKMSELSGLAVYRKKR